MSVRFGHFFLSSYRVNHDREVKIEQNPSLVKLVEGFKFGGSNFNGDGVGLIQQNVRKGLERTNERERKKQTNKQTKRIPLLYGDT